MRAVLGIDAAWTVHNPSGVALAAQRDGAWHLVAVAPSFAAFYALRGAKEQTAFDAPRLLDDATHLAGARPDLVALDMPLMDGLITTRRRSDNAIASAYGARGASTHSPSALRPGPLAVDMLAALTSLGYPLLCTNPITGPGTLEVYPHPALIELTGAARRLPYKVHNRGKYWPALTGPERLANLFAQWTTILAALDIVLPGTAALAPLPAPDAPLRHLKAFEDSLDAIICAWVGICALEGRAIAHGDARSAIWVPAPYGT
ncbi:DUF429 domain-containing protein [Devosia chinhatensis]|uniref:DUF429 domain-containing protein n=1 Tax=Devosia chinhatensis TaxID=429727 RepID=A0A0F5FMT4_9HYPH|nr:DUF429 domain-containing protein [Devosia chinhatensis]KKB10151.1 hypothetical protein VE26_10330 [Devosia chinhatensis]